MYQKLHNQSNKKYPPLSPASTKSTGQHVINITQRKSATNTCNVQIVVKLSKTFEPYAD